MKKYNWLKFLAFAVLMMPLWQSCTDLEEELFSDVTEDNFFKTDEELASALGAAYRSLSGYAGGAPLALQVSSDEFVVPTRGQDWDDGGHWRRLHTHNYNFEDPEINGGWNFCYGGISNCNRLIFQFENTDIDEKQREEVIAELRTLRALFYLWLVDLYGRVPIVDRFDVPADFQPPNNSRQEVYDFIEKEVQESLPNLQEEVGQATYGRATKWVGHMILASLYLNSEVYTGTPRWAEAAEQANEVINSGQFSLAGNYFDNFNVDNSGSPEFIMAIPYDEVFYTGFNLWSRTLHYLNRQTYNLQGQPWNGFCTLEEFYNSYEDGDIRKGSPNTEDGPSGVRGNFLVGPQFSITGERLLDNAAEDFDPDGEPLTFTPEINELGPNALRQAGARIGKFEFAINATRDMSNDFPIFRYAEALMIRAEALWRQNPGDGEALALVNQIRERAGVEPFTELTEDNLLAEHGREFFAEIKRRSTLIRFDRFNDAWWEKPEDPSDHVNIFPIPRPQMDANKSLTQNPGY